MVSYTELLLFLRQNHYNEVPALHESGDFLVQGDTITYCPVNAIEKYRIHFFDEVFEKAEKMILEKWQPAEKPPELVPNHIHTEHGRILPGEYVVHPFHGVGIFEKIETRINAGKATSFVSLKYAGNDKLLFPFSRHLELMPYIGSRHPRLTRLYSKSWQKTKEKVEKDLIRVARELLKIYAARQLTTRPGYTHNPEWEQILEKGVEFELTEDQKRALKDIDQDLSNLNPMDRLVCGDVGFGKTEVALRAAAQVISAEKQVVFIAPTTILAEQHYTVMRDRFKDLPVTVGHISRLTSSQDKNTLQGVAEGKIDILIGTHRALGKDILFKDLGLLIVDEEQKFGVAQKERLKEVRPHLDVLALSATPIPRTLSMSLSGLRGLSILRTPPQGRLPIKTHIEPYSDSRLGNALLAELKRGGQIYVVHNRVQSLAAVENKVLEQLKLHKIDNISVAKAHGQMPEKELAKTMTDFLSGEIQVLVASTIVEHGLDSPGANTLIVLHSEWFGLSDLYQLRGRVGRRKKQAYAHFLLGGVERSGYQEAGQELSISETARKRLKALKEADVLGSGWSIALRDLEIRGSGNILGNEQHGSMEAIGLLLYSQLLQEEIGRQAKRLNIPLFQKMKNEEED